MEANTDFICPLCGKSDLTWSAVTLQANYGSDHDGERVTVKVCGGCVDLLIGFVRGHNIPHTTVDTLENITDWSKDK